MTKTHGRCPQCGANDAYTEWEEGRGFCHSQCGNVILEEYKEKERKRMYEEPSGFTYEGIRSLDAKVAEQYGILLQLDANGDPLRYAYRYPNGQVKYRDYKDKKRTWLKEKGRGMHDLFGPEINPGSVKRVYLTEGEFDAASLFQILGGSYPVLSLPSSNIGDEFIKKHIKFLQSFPEVVYCGELDEAGKKAADRLYKAIPERFYYVPLDKHKDANDFLKAGDGEELAWSARRPQRWAPENFFCSDDAVSKAIREENPYEYTPTGHTDLDDKIRGLVKGGLTFLLAPPGTGKTELFRYFEVGLLKNSPDAKVGILHMEEQKSTTYRAFATYELGVNVRTKEDAIANGISEEQVIEAAQMVTQGDRTVVFEMKHGDEAEAVVDYCRLAAGVYGCDYIFIDHVQRLAYLTGIDGATNTLTKIGANLAQLSKELNVGIILISHVNEDGQTKYAKSLQEEACILIKISRDKEATDEDMRNTTFFEVTKNRPFSKLGKAGAVKWDSESTLVTEWVDDR